MKIQKAEMKFVSFDAQDVIATSGGPFFAYFTVGAELYPEATYENNGSWSQGIFSTKLTVDSGDVTDGTIYQLDESSSYSFGAGFFNITGASVTTTPQGESQSTLTDIATWLGKHGLQ